MPKPRQPRFSQIFAAHDSGAERAEAAKVAWAEALAELEAAGLATASRMHTLKRYVLARVEYDFAYSAATHKGAVIEGPNGGQVFSMSYSAMLKMSDQILKLEDALLIAPKSAGEKAKGKPSGNAKSAADNYLNAH